MKKASITAACLVLFAQLFYAQNLVPNPNFEDYVDTYCGADGIPEVFNDWYSPSEGSPDVFFTNIDASCINFQPSGSNIIFGTQLPHSGTSMIGIGALADTDLREYIQVQLNEEMQEGEVYIVEYYISAAESCTHFIDQFGVLFTEEAFEYTHPNPLDLEPQSVVNYLFNDLENWTLISDTIVAEENYEFLTIGNFQSTEELNFSINSENPFIAIEPNLPPVFYYLIDDVSVSLLNEPENFPTLPESGSVYTYASFSMFGVIDRHVIPWGNDVVINDTTYREFGNGQGSELLLMRAEENIWYMRTPDFSSYSETEIPLYDWSAEEGDILMLGNPDAVGTDFIPEILIDSINVQNDLLGNPRKHYFFTNLSNENANALGQHWIEGIGTTYNLDWSAGSTIVDAGLQLVCAEINGDLVYENPVGELYENCDWTSSIEEHVLNISIYPSPFVNELSISSDIALQSAMLTDLSGKLLLDTPLSTSTASLDLSTFDSGMYLLQVTFTSGKTITRRVVKG